MYKIFILGIADSGLTARQDELLSQCTVIVGSKRFKALTAHLSRRFMQITPLNKAIESIRAFLQEGDVAVLASGDPLFYGIGRRLLAEFSAENIEIYPALSSLQKACALFKIPWDDARLTSLHGRDCRHIPGLLLKNRKNLVLTDTENSPDKIATRVLEYLQLVGETVLPDTIKMLVAEDLGLESERLFSGTLFEGCQQQFSTLNIMCLLVPGTIKTIPGHLGLTENVIQHSRGLITKNEIRAATLHQLQVPRRGVFWDVGAGSGSLSLEASRLGSDVTVYAVEHKEEELKNIKINIVKFGCYNIVPIFGRAPEALNALPDPDRIFVGGSSGSLPDIVALAASRLRPGGRLVINGVIEKTVQTAPELMRNHGFTVASSVIKVTRTEPDGRVLDFNPITIMTGTR